MAFTLYERQYFGIHGLLPPAFMTEDQQAYRVITNLRQQPDDLARYIQLDNLQERDEKLYYRVICDHIKELLPIVYTPTTLLEDPFYIGLRRKRVRGEEYNHFIDNFMKACTKRFGQNLLIQFEDFARHNAYHLLAKYRNQYCVFNDDIQGTAAVALAGLLACRRYTGRPLSTEKIIFLALALYAAMGIANLCITQMEKEGINRKDAHSRIYLMDIDGLITQNRLHMEKEHIPYAKGKVLFASGSPFKNVEYKGSVGMAVILFQIRHIDDEVFLIAAQEVAKCVNDEDFKHKRLFPSINRIREVSLKIILAIGKYSYEKNLATLYPKPANMENFVRSQYQTTYNEMIGYTYDWPENDMVHGYRVPYEKKHDD
ncbi:Malic enzyme [Dirofilaria immitis]|nr:Malic enzyme [Dirofilaria immitis]